MTGKTLGLPSHCLKEFRRLDPGKELSSEITRVLIFSVDIQGGT